jgi:hypothetical protein
MKNESQLAASLRQLLGEPSTLEMANQEQMEVVNEMYNSPEVAEGGLGLIRVWKQVGIARFAGAIAGAIAFFGENSLSTPERDRCCTVAAQIARRLATEENLDLAESLYTLGMCVYTVFSNLAWLEHLGPVPEE